MIPYTDRDVTLSAEYNLMSDLCSNLMISIDRNVITKPWSKSSVFVERSFESVLLTVICYVLHARDWTNQKAYEFPDMDVCFAILFSVLSMCRCACHITLVVAPVSDQFNWFKSRYRTIYAHRKIQIDAL